VAGAGSIDIIDISARCASRGCSTHTKPTFVPTETDIRRHVELTTGTRGRHRTRCVIAQTNFYYGGDTFIYDEDTVEYA